MNRRQITLAFAVAALTLGAAAATGPTADAGHDLGGTIAFGHLDPAGGPEDIFTISAEGSNLQQVTETPDDQGGSELPEWAPNGERLLFDSDRAGNVHVFSTNQNNGHVEQLTDGDGF